MGWLTIFHHAEFFLVTRILIRAIFGAAGLHPFFEFFHIADLGFVIQQGREFDVPGIGHVEYGVWLAGERAPDFFWHVRFQSLGEEFGEEDATARGGEDRVEYNLSAGAVVGMVDAVGGE